MNNKYIAKTAIIAVLFFVVNTVFSAISFGAVQVRIANIMYQFIPYNKRYFLALILGVALANTVSPLGWLDMVFGVGTSVAGLGSAILINKYIDSLLGRKIVTAFTVSLATIFVAYELNIAFNAPLLPTFVTVAIGQLISQIVGIFATSAINKRIDLSQF
ncbi:MAG: QueT transporter family protein [Tetragenococcus sp.]|nr:QueT transporter family protein [Tetragenococcus sp.]